MGEYCLCYASDEPENWEPVQDGSAEWALQCPRCAHLDYLRWVSDEARPLVLGLARRRGRMRLRRPRPAQDDGALEQAEPGYRDVVIYSSNRCPYSWRARRLLRRRGYTFEVVDVGGEQELRTRLSEITGRKTLPLVFVGGRLIGGFDELRAMDRSGKLERLIRGATC